MDWDNVMAFTSPPTLRRCLGRPTPSKSERLTYEACRIDPYNVSLCTRDPQDTSNGCANSSGTNELLLRGGQYGKTTGAIEACRSSLTKQPLSNVQCRGNSLFGRSSVRPDIGVTRKLVQRGNENRRTCKALNSIHGYCESLWHSDQTSANGIFADLDETMLAAMTT